MKNLTRPLFAQQSIYILIGLAILVNFTGLFDTILGPDGILYASISKTMALNNNFKELFDGSRDWLDKPHLPFWITAFSFKLFGIHTWSYKLPAILFLLIGARYTFLLARQLYNRDIALWSVFILLTAQHIVISNNDVRAEPYLTGLLIAAVYHFYRATQKKWSLHLVAGALFAAGAVMTKGIFILIPIGLAIAGHLLSQKDYKGIFDLKWLIAVALVGIFILPELYCLWYQFDLHPEKLIFNQTHVSGLRFFFWDSQFGRFFNTGPIKGTGDPLFFFHTLLWAFLPWGFLLYYAFGSMIFNRRIKQTEWLTVFASLSVFFLFSLSRFQLPHYTNIIFPFFAIITGAFLYRRIDADSKYIRITQLISCCLALVALLLLHFTWKSAELNLLFIILFVATAIIFVWILGSRSITGIIRWLYFSGLTSILISLYLNLLFYPSLLTYQSGSEAAFYCNANYPKMPVYAYGSPADYELDFYLEHPLHKIHDPKELVHLTGPVLLYIPKDSSSVLTFNGLKPVIIKEYEHFSVSQLSFDFLKAGNRSKETSKHQLLLLP